MTEAPNIVTIPLTECEFCRTRVRKDTLVCLGDVSVCQKCNAEWTAKYDACDHEWEQETHDPHRVCKKCHGTDYAQLNDSRAQGKSNGG